ncbi:MAG: hypothetical protein RLZZ490_301 [Cyanobacteriota bacterium]
MGLSVEDFALTISGSVPFIVESDQTSTIVKPRGISFCSVTGQATLWGLEGEAQDC